MTYNFKIIKPIDWNELTDFFKRNWISKYHYKGGVYDWSVEYTKWTISQFLWDEDLLYGMFEGDKLIGLISGSHEKLVLNLESQVITLKGVAMGYQTIDMSYRKKGLFNKLLKAYADHVKELGYDLITSFPVKRWEDVLKKHGFSIIHKDPQFYVKFMGKEGVDKIREIRGLNKALAMLAKALAGIPQDRIPYGKIIDGSSSDAERIVGLLNSYQATLVLSQLYDVSDFKQYLELSKEFFDSLDDPLKFRIKIWESDDNEILAVMIYIIQNITFTNGKSPVHFVEFLAFSDKITDKNDKKAFYAEIYSEIPKSIPVSIDSQPYNDLKARKSGKYDNDRDARKLLVKPLTENGKKMLSIKKLKEFSLMNIDQ